MSIRYAMQCLHMPGRLKMPLPMSDVFIGLSVANILSQEMVRSMARDPIIFAMANPDPEITYEDVQAARSDVIFGTGRSDYPNQVNNVLGFPFIFPRCARCASDCHQYGDEACAATEHWLGWPRRMCQMELCAHTDLIHLRFGRDYIIPNRWIREF